MPKSGAILLILLSATAGASAQRSPLAEQTIIRRDTFGVPHILANSEEAAAFAMGYAQAEDHCVEIARRFVSARGEEAKYTGAGLETDFAGKRYGIYENARKNFDKLSPLAQRMSSAYAAGLNLYVEKHRRELPAWIPVFDGVDVLARSRQEVFRFAFNRGDIIRAVQQKYPADAQTQGPQPAPRGERESLHGSNLWSLAGSRTTSGNPILLGNPHQAWAALYWEAHVTVPGAVNFYGATFVGRPMLTSGFNDYLGWTHTVNNIDLEDIYALQLDPERPNHYLFDGQSLPLTKREFAVEIKSAQEPPKTERRIYSYTHLGPVVHRTRDKTFAIKSAIFDEYRFYEGWYALCKARNLSEFRTGLQMNLLPMFNVGYADVDGNIFYLWNGQVPRRLEDGTDYRLDVPGNTKYVWRQLHRTEELPQLLNPRGGYVQNCNDAPWWTSLRDPLDPKRFPSYIEPGVPLRLRSQMSLEMLEGQERFSLHDVMRLKFNSRMLLAERVKPALIEAIKQAKSPSQDLQRGLAVMEAWDNRTSADSRGGVLFLRFWDTYRTAIKEPYAVPWSNQNPAKTPYGLSDIPPSALKHFEDAVRWTRQTYGAENVAWGDVHRIRLGDVDLPATGAGGEYGLFHVVQFAPARDGKRVVGTAERGRPLAGGGDGFILAVEFSRPPVAYSLLAYGQTTNTASKHSTDQAPLFAKGQFKRVWFTEADIKANLERAYHPGE